MKLCNFEHLTLRTETSLSSRSANAPPGRQDWTAHRRESHGRAHQRDIEGRASWSQGPQCCEHARPQGEPPGISDGFSHAPDPLRCPSSSASLPAQPYLRTRSASPRWQPHHLNAQAHRSPPQHINSAPILDPQQLVSLHKPASRQQTNQNPGRRQNSHLQETESA